MNGINRGGFLASIPPVTKNILIINVAVYLLDLGLKSMRIDITEHLALYNFKSPYFNPYQIITHMFMHGSLGHIFFNMFGVFMFGRVIETVIGSKKFFLLYMMSGIGAALLQLAITNFQLQALQNSVMTLSNAPTPEGCWAIMHKYNYILTDQATSIIQAWKENPNSLEYSNQAMQILNSLVIWLINNPMIGASGAVFGVLIAFGMLFPNVELMLIFFPVPIKAKYLIPGYAVLELFLGVAQFKGDNIAHYAHLGGAIVGFFLVRYWKKNQFPVY